MAESFPPTRDADLLLWSTSFATKINALQPAGAYGLTPQQCTDYQTANDLFASKLALAASTASNSTQNVIAKADAREALVAMARALVAIIQSNPATTNEERAHLEIPVRDAEYTPVPPPDTAPVLTIEDTFGTYIDIRLRDLAAPDSRGKPAGVAGATIFSAFGITAPDLADVEAWTFRGNVTRTLTTLDFAGAASGTTAWLTAFWYNSKGESGPPTQPVSVQIPGQAAQQSSQNLQFPEGLQEAA
ncbi:MAG: hypothetical protein ACR2GY_06930 [Phycisphaerales bacterium]